MATARASTLRVHATVLAHRFDPRQAPIRPAATLLTDAVEALGNVVMASNRRLGFRGHPWELVNWFTSGLLFAPMARTG